MVAQSQSYSVVAEVPPVAPLPLSGLEYFRRILQAPVYQLAKETPLTALQGLSQQLAAQVWLKREDLQPVHSFKLRGAFNKLLHSQAGSTVVTASAGNHAQGVALSAKTLGLRAIIVMPTSTPDIKVKAVRALGGEVVLFGENFDAANQHAKQLTAQLQAEFIPPFDDAQVIIGQGTVAKELMQQCPQLDMVFVPVGGGGLLAGMAVYIKNLNPDVKVIGVEVNDSACLQAALAHGAPVTLDYVGTFADGVAVKRIGEETFRLAQTYCDEVITVSSDEICTAIRDIFQETRAVAEPAGAVSLAGLKAYARERGVQGKVVAAVLSGANINFDRLRYVAERTELGAGNEALFSVTIPEQKGSFKTFCKALGGRVITEFNYRYNDARQAQIFVGVRVADKAEISAIAEQLQQAGYSLLDLTDNELAKLHLRYLVGGKPVLPISERIFQFEFPESPGALAKFLATLGSQWNISLFHYRNHGAAIGQVLAGIEVPLADEPEFQAHLQALDYVYIEQTANPAYQHFL